MRSIRKGAAGWLATGAALLAANSALAQDTTQTQEGDPERNVPVQERERPEFDPLNVRLRSFILAPSVQVSGNYDTNVFTQSRNGKSDFFTSIQPTISLKSDWSRHQLNFETGADLTRYFNYDERDANDFYANIGGRLDISRDNILSGRGRVERLHEEPDSPDSPAGKGLDVVEYYRNLVELSYRHNFNRLFTIVGGDITRLDFEDQNGQDEDTRDRNQYRGKFRLGYQLSPRINVFGDATYDVRRYDETPALDRDSQGVNLQVGSGIDITSVLFGEAGVGYVYRKYQDSQLDSVNGVSANAGITWNITQLTSLNFTAQADVLESTITYEDDQASSNYRKSFGVEVWHELLRNVLLNANADYYRDDFEGTSRSDDTVDLGGGVRYLLNRNLSLDANYSYRTRWSDENDSEYSRNLIMIGLTAQL